MTLRFYLYFAAIVAVGVTSGSLDAETATPQNGLKVSIARLADLSRPPSIGDGAPRSLAFEPLAQESAPSVAPPEEALPNGAVSITERYGDWITDCHVQDGQKLCVMSQVQPSGQNGQQRSAIELRPPKDDDTQGTILMPFGLKLNVGAILKLDGNDFGESLSFSTCIADGCLLPFSFPMDAINAMKAAKTLTVGALSLANDQPVVFNISLDGFAAALNRITELGR